MGTTPLREILAAAAPASRVEGRFLAGTMASGAEIAIPWVAIKGSREGRCLWINGQVHGPEINGVLAALDFVNRVRPSDLSGSIVVSATANPLALDARTKTTPQDEGDLDQSFPGDAGGLPTERLAHTLFEQARGCADLLVNLHTMGHMFDSRPYAVYKLHPNGKVDEQALLAMIAPFRPGVACRMRVEQGLGELPGNIAGALDYQMLALGIPAFMIELGSGSRAEAPYIAQGIAGFEDVARRMGILPGDPGRYARLKRVARRAHVTVSHGGLFRAAKFPGETVRAADPLGSTMDLHGKVVESLALREECIVIGMRRDPVVHSGDRAAFVALEWDEVAGE
ncbi:MAG: succinylglutamate desuccinylase/aspartoacylase family protein [Betaproteobacteria bacterium]|nr:succinylglutamate desuccinylase/aspartoacylase family protein [Betaproteobacteria bacterium]